MRVLDFGESTARSMKRVMSGSMKNRERALELRNKLAERADGPAVQTDPEEEMWVDLPDDPTPAEAEAAAASKTRQKSGAEMGASARSGPGAAQAASREQQGGPITEEELRLLREREAEAEFKEWLANEAAPPVDDPAVATGRDMFFNTSCVNCHRIGGTIAQGVFGPDLTHLMTRQTIGAGAAPLTPEKLHEWVKDPQDIKIGCLMPDMQLTPDEVDAITKYLLTLK